MATAVASMCGLFRVICSCREDDNWQDGRVDSRYHQHQSDQHARIPAVARVANVTQGCQSPVQVSLPAARALFVRRCVAVGHLPGDVLSILLAVYSFPIYQHRHGRAALPESFLVRFLRFSLAARLVLAHGGSDAVLAT
jgi:hypothetical protein